MQVQVTSDNLELTPSMQELANSKITKLSSRFEDTPEDLVSIRVVLNKSGADGIINKASEDVEILNALNAVEKGNIFLCPITSGIINNKRDKVRELNQINALTPREREILYLICNDELTNNQIADKLNISEKTVKTHRKNIYHKLNVNTTIQLVRAAINLAYISVVK